MPDQNMPPMWEGALSRQDKISGKWEVIHTSVAFHADTRDQALMQIVADYYEAEVGDLDDAADVDKIGEDVTRWRVTLHPFGMS